MAREPAPSAGVGRGELPGNQEIHKDLPRLICPALWGHRGALAARGSLTFRYEDKGYEMNQGCSWER